MLYFKLGIVLRIMSKMCEHHRESFGKCFKEIILNFMSIMASALDTAIAI